MHAPSDKEINQRNPYHIYTYSQQQYYICLIRCPLVLKIYFESVNFIVGFRTEELWINNIQFLWFSIILLVFWIIRSYVVWCVYCIVSIHAIRHFSPTQSRFHCFYRLVAVIRYMLVAAVAFCFVSVARLLFAIANKNCLSATIFFFFVIEFKQ